MRGFVFAGRMGVRVARRRVGAGPSTSVSQDLGYHRNPKSQSAICKPLPSAARVMIGAAERER
jgi:hypothetical protein